MNECVAKKYQGRPTEKYNNRKNILVFEYQTYYSSKNYLKSRLRATAQD